ncbi:MAG: sulfatase-like hydrolase/transferase, partial [Clostridia bacterium]|nr:sulfatase-like hydrolase/transferase [Clostridia bacterium]
MKSRKPNVIVIVPHDTGTSYGCYGNKDVQTPCIDKMAEEGAVFYNNFGTAPFCSPSRGSIITGKWPHVNGLMGLTNMGWDLPKENLTDAILFNKGGYDTILCGLQHEMKSSDDLGFETIIPTDTTFCADVTPKIVDFIKNRKSNRSFYLRTGFIEAHRVGKDNLWQPYKDRAPEVDEITVPDFLADTPRAREQHSQFYGSINAIDEAVGQICDALKESGLEDDTLIVYTTDHGIPFPKAKATLFDNGTNTVLIMKYPRLIKKNSKYDNLISNIDLLPTLLDLCGIDIPDDMNGKSFSPLLKNGDYEEN